MATQMRTRCAVATRRFGFRCNRPQLLRAMSCLNCALPTTTRARPTLANTLTPAGFGTGHGQAPTCVSILRCPWSPAVATPRPISLASGALLTENHCASHFLFFADVLLKDATLADWNAIFSSVSPTRCTVRNASVKAVVYSDPVGIGVA